MIVTESSAVFQKAHEALVERHRVHMNPQALLTVLEAVLEGRVTEKHAERRFRQGQADTQEKYDLILLARDALGDARTLIGLCVAWSGDEDYRERVTARIDALIDALK